MKHFIRYLLLLVLPLMGIASENAGDHYTERQDERQAIVVNRSAEIFRAQGINVTTEVTFRNPNNPQIEARIDQVLSGNANASVPVPQGFTAIDYATGKTVNQLQLDARGKAGVEIKTGNANLERHQATIYQSCIAGDGCAFGVGKNASTAKVLDEEVPRNIYILRPFGD